MSVFINENNIKKNVSKIFADVNGEKKQIVSAWSNKNGVATKVFGLDDKITPPKFISIADSTIRKGATGQFSYYWVCYSDDLTTFNWKKLFGHGDYSSYCHLQQLEYFENKNLYMAVFNLYTIDRTLLLLSNNGIDWTSHLLAEEFGNELYTIFYIKETDMFYAFHAKYDDKNMSAYSLFSSKNLIDWTLDENWNEPFLYDSRNITIFYWQQKLVIVEQQNGLLNRWFSDDYGNTWQQLDGISGGGWSSSDFYKFYKACGIVFFNEKLLLFYKDRGHNASGYDYRTRCIILPDPLGEVQNQTVLVEKLVMDNSKFRYSVVNGKLAINTADDSRFYFSEDGENFTKMSFSRSGNTCFDYDKNTGKYYMITNIVKEKDNETHTEIYESQKIDGGYKLIHSSSWTDYLIVCEDEIMRSSIIR